MDIVMSWAEEQPWFGLEDQALAATYEVEEQNYQEPDFDIDSSIWICKDGTEIAIKNMTNNHIINCINMIKRSIRNGRPWRVNYLLSFKRGLTHRVHQIILEDASKRLEKSNNTFRKLIQTIKNI